MPATLRLTNQERELLRKKAVELNKVLINRGLRPLKESELAHIILDKTIAYAKVGSSGDIVIDLP